MTLQKYFPLALSWCIQFFLSTLFSWRNLQNKMDTYLLRYSSWYLKKCPFCFVNFSVKTRSTEKVKYSTTKPTENTTELSSQIFDFWNFATEILNFRSDPWTPNPCLEFDYPDNTHLRHPEDCQKFLHCAHGFPEEKTCPPGTLWNDPIKACDHAGNVDCNA